MPSCLTQQSSTPLNHWRCAVVSGTKMSAADPVNCELGPPQFTLVCLVNLKAKAYTGNFFLCSSNHPWKLFSFFFFLHQGTWTSWKRPRPSEVTSTFLLFIAPYLTRRCNFNQKDRRVIGPSTIWAREAGLLHWTTWSSLVPTHDPITGSPPFTSLLTPTTADRHSS